MNNEPKNSLLITVNKSGYDRPILCQFNLVYGFNGNGKTTLAQILASLGAGARGPAMPDDSTSEVQTVQSSPRDFTETLGRVH